MMMNDPVRGTQQRSLWRRVSRGATRTRSPEKSSHDEGWEFTPLGGRAEPRRGVETPPSQAKVATLCLGLVRCALPPSSRSEDTEAAVVAGEVGRAARTSLRLDPSAAVA